MSSIHFPVQPIGTKPLLLHLSAAFDIIDYNILLRRLHTFIGLLDTNLDWSLSYLLARTQSFYCGDALSKPSSARHGIPQGSVPDILGSVFFSCLLAGFLDVLLSHFSFKRMINKSISASHPLFLMT